MRFYLFIFTILSSFLSGDVIHFMNGDRLTGNIIEMKEEKLEFKTASMGTLTIDWQSVRTVETNEAYPIDLKSGDSLIVFFKPDGDKEKVVELETSGKEFKASLPLDSILTIIPREDKWSTTVALGYSSLKGNSNQTKVNTSIEAVRPFTKHGKLKNQITVNGSINYSRSSQTTSVRKGKFNGVFDSYISPQLNWYFSETISYNFLQDLRLRAVEALGVEYTLVNKNGWTVKPTIAISRLDSFYTKDAVLTGDANYFSLSPSIKFQWITWRNITLKNHTLITPDIKNLNDYIFDCDTSLSLPLARNFALLLGYDLCITSKPPKGIGRKDQTSSVSFSYTF